MDEARQKELDQYEARFGKYVDEHGKFGMMAFTVGVQSFPIFWEDDPEASKEENDAHRKWFKRMLCNAIHNLVDAESTKERS